MAIKVHAELVVVLVHSSTYKDFRLVGYVYFNRCIPHPLLQGRYHRPLSSNQLKNGMQN